METWDRGVGGITQGFRFPGTALTCYVRGVFYFSVCVCVFTICDRTMRRSARRERPGPRPRWGRVPPPAPASRSRGSKGVRARYRKYALDFTLGSCAAAAARGTRDPGHGAAAHKPQARPPSFLAFYVVQYGVYIVSCM